MYLVFVRKIMVTLQRHHFFVRLKGVCFFSLFTGNLPTYSCDEFSDCIVRCLDCNSHSFDCAVVIYWWFQHQHILSDNVLSSRNFLHTLFSFGLRHTITSSTMKVRSSKLRLLISQNSLQSCAIIESSLFDHHAQEATINLRTSNLLTQILNNLFLVGIF